MDSDESETLKKRTIGVKRRAAVLAGILATCLLVACLLIGKMRERKIFVSKTVTGYRYRFTLSKDWQSAPAVSSTSPDESEGHQFTLKPSPIREWIVTRLLHQKATTGNTPSDRPSLLVATMTAKERPDFIRIRGGYPEPNLGDLARVVSEHHLRVDGCPATAVRLAFVGNGSTPFYGTFLCVSRPDFSYDYLVGTLADQQDNDQANREMEAIIDSFHVDHTERVSVPADRKP